MWDGYLDVCVCIRWVVLLDLHLHPFCSRPNSQEEHKRKHGPHGDDDQRFSLSNKGGEGDGSAEGEKDREWRRRSSKGCRVGKQSRKSREISRWTCRRDVRRPVVKRREGVLLQNPGGGFEAEGHAFFLGRRAKFPATEP